MAFCGEASTWAKVSLILTTCALGLQCAGYGTNYWTARYTVREKINFGIGLWKVTNCSGGYEATCSESMFPDSYLNNFVQATRAMASCALIMIFVCTICLAFYVGSQRSRTRGMAIAVMTMLFFAAKFGITGMVVWLVNIPEYHYASWSLGLTVFAITLVITAAILLITDIREYDYKDLLKVGGRFQNLTVTHDEHPPPAPAEVYQYDIKPVIEPQGPGQAPVSQFIQYDKRRGMDGF